jgi:amino acid adenylation domain-containing protein
MQINLLEYFEQGALSLFPNKTAIVDGDQTITFSQLNDIAKRFATSIIKASSITNAPIAVLLPKGIWGIAADIGILMTGNCYMNIDIKSPEQRVMNILNNVKPALVITNFEIASFVQKLGVSQIIIIEKAIVSERDDGLIESRQQRVIDKDPACIINTSGSTGVPKSVVMNHHSIIDFMDWLFGRFPLTGEERIGSLSPFYFDIYTLELWYCLAKGATFFIIPEQLAMFPIRIIEFLQNNQISFIFWVPTIMVNVAAQKIFATICPNSLKYILFAGEVFPTKYFNYWRLYLPQARFVNLYGPIEITVDCTFYEIDREFSDEEALPIGFPCRNTDILILNQDDKLVNPGEVGELCVRGSSLAMGYWNDEEKTAKAFVQNPLNKSYPELIYRTGDLVHTNERGEIMFDGRRDFQIKHQGYRIELSEIEHVLISKMDTIQNACVLYNYLKKEITLFYTSDHEISLVEIRKKVGEVLPKYMLPTALRKLDSMPRNPNGKIDRQKLKEMMEKAKI